MLLPPAAGRIDQWHRPRQTQGARDSQRHDHWLVRSKRLPV